MSKFEYMGFGYDGGRDEMFVTHANKYTVEETIKLCLEEFGNRFTNNFYRPKLRKPTTADVFDSHCAFRFGVSPEWPDGCYTFVGQNEPGAFPIRVIELEKLEKST